ncbi:unnamed protein product [Caenorhabditis angaria]|uniref:G-protein coupled receptors family 1 profile domain-containing protein n=1 Tax=Caenorhabditis angaria TaxID=860376 RepID=A0A9P1N2N5_9PELO|nr:unnamed protein product [Caenorhabditis angaria]
MQFVTYWTLLAFIDFLAVFLNSLLIFLAIFKTPKAVKIYTLLIINIGLADCCAALANLIIQVRMIPIGDCLVTINYGVCRILGRRFCFAGYTVMAHAITHSNTSKFLSFAYRYYILFHNEPKRTQVILVILANYLPSFTSMILYNFALASPEILISEVMKKHSYPNLTDLCVTGVEDISNPFALPLVINMTYIPIPMFLGILQLRKKILKRLEVKDYELSITTKAMHSQLLNALTYQAIIPCIYISNLVMYILEQFGGYSNEFMEIYMFAGLVVIPLFSPFPSFLFFKPYRTFFSNVFKASLGKKVKKESSKSVVTYF